GVDVDAQTALFDHDVAFFIEFAYYGLLKTRCLEVGPEFQPVRRKGVEVDSLVGKGGGMLPLAAFLFHDLAEFIRLYKLVSFRDRVFPCFLKLGKLLRVLSDHSVSLGEISLVRFLDFLERYFFGRTVCRTNPVFSLEIHMPEHVS